MKNITRRDFLKSAAALGLSAGVLGASGLAYADEKPQADLLEGTGILANELEASVVVVEPITDISEEKSYDVVVIGGGTTGIPAAIAASEAGAKVAVLQKQAYVLAQGNLVAYVDLDKSDDIGVMQYVHELHSIYDMRGSLSLQRTYAYKSQEAVTWFLDELKAIGFENMKESDSKLHEYEDGACQVIGTLFPKQMIEPMTALADTFADRGIDIFYSTPAVQLVKDNGAVKSVIAKDENGNYIKFNASKGIILATGDYQNNAAMVERYTPDARFFQPKQMEKTGDGHLMGQLIGAQMERGTHCKMVHASGASVMREEPLFALNMNGERFMFEDVAYGARNSILGDQPENKMVSIFDANYMEYVTGWGSDPTVPTVGNASPEKLESFVEKGVALKADTLEELYAAAGLPVETAMASTARYNELCALGKDLDFGKASKYMKPVDTAPFYCQVRTFQVSAIPAGLLINDDGQCVTSDGTPIEGLYAAGNCSGCFYGDNDYSLSTMGLSLGRCVTFGYLTGKLVAGK